MGIAEIVHSVLHGMARPLADWVSAFIIDCIIASSEGLEKYLVGYQPRTSICLSCGYLVVWGNGTNEGGQEQARFLACSCLG